LEAPQLERLDGGARCAVAAAATEAHRGGEHRRHVDGHSEAQHCGHPTGAVGREEVAYDVVRLVERRARVGIDEPGELQTATPRAYAFAMPRPSLRARVDERIEVEDRECFADLPAVRTTLELVELEQPRRLPARALDVQPRADAEQRGGDGGRDVERAPHGA